MYPPMLVRAVLGPLWVCLAICIPSLAASPEKVERPNVLIVLVDDLGFSDLSCYGGEIPTPNIDRLAAAGARFTQAYTSARCCPTRASLMTGLHPHQTGVGFFATNTPDARRGPAYLGHLNDRCVTVAEVLKAAGYHTYMVGKWHMSEPGPIARGFDEFYGFVQGYAQDQWTPERYQRLPADRSPELKYEDGEFYATDVFTDYALEFLRQARSKSGPWLLYLAHSSPHFPVQAPAGSADRFAKTYERGWDVLRAERFARMRQIGLATDAWKFTERSIVPVDRPGPTNGYGGRQNPAWDSLPADRQADLTRRMALFAAMVSHVDQGIGRITADLEAHGELNNTLVFFLSDNGACYEWGPFGFDRGVADGGANLHSGAELREMGRRGTYSSYGSGWANLSNTPLRMYKHYTHEGGLATPLIVHWPAGTGRPDKWVRDPVHVMDILPTICEATGAAYPREFHGRPVLPAEGINILPAIRGDRLPERPLAFEHDGARAYRQGRWKVVWSKRMPFEIRWELYDIASDRCETVNLAEKFPERAAALAEQWEAWAKRVKVYPFYQPEGATVVPADQVPQVANRPLRIRCRVTPSGGNGVILAHGGDRYGYALHLVTGNLFFTVRVAGEPTTVKACKTPTGKLDIVAKLTANAEMILRINGELAATGQAPGLIPVQLVDGLSLGQDTATAVGDSAAPFPLEGQVEEYAVEPGPAGQDKE